MSEVVVRMEMPWDCTFCPMAHWDCQSELAGCNAVNDVISDETYNVV